MKISPFAQRKAFLFEATKLLIVFVLIFFVINAVSELVLRIVYELKGPYTADTPLYWAVGRGILNGLKPYVDLFENKPPGIFLLSALSFWMFDSPILGHIVQSIAIGGLPIVLLVAVVGVAGEKRSFAMYILCITAFLFGVILALYSAERSGAFQVESFGAFFIMLYLCLLSFMSREVKRSKVLLASFFLLCAIGFKEPFLVTAFAGALLISKDFSSLTRSFFVPVLIAVLAGAIALMLLGYFIPFFAIYFSDSISLHVELQESLFQRALNITRLMNDISSYSEYFYDSIVILVTFFVYYRIRKWKGFLSLMYSLFSLFLAFYLAAFSVGLSGKYWNHHFVFALPVYAALFLVFARDVYQNWSDWDSRAIAISVTVVICLGILDLPEVDYSRRLSAKADLNERAKQLAFQVDSILDQCGEDRYLFLGSNGRQPYAYTKHSPLGPLFFQLPHLLRKERSYFREAMRRQFEEASFVVLREYLLNDLNGYAKEYLAKNFSEDPWPCAEDIGQSSYKGYRFLYRDMFRS